MASSYTNLGIELMNTGENAGTWGNKTNTNLQLIQQLLFQMVLHMIFNLKDGHFYFKN